MSTLSMTGFGRASAHGDGLLVEVEVASVNRKQFDCVVSIPGAPAIIEERVRAAVHARLTRGHVQVKAKVVCTSSAAGAVDEVLVKEKVALLGAVAKAAGIRSDITLSDLLRFPDLFDTDSFADPELVWTILRSALERALDSHMQMRVAEGQTLRRDLEARLDRMRAIRSAIAEKAPLVPALYRDALKHRLEELLGAAVQSTDPVLMREIAVVADKCDVTEELTRIASHIDHAIALFDSAEPAGRKLDFLAQELNREANTIASKANSSDIASCVIDLKALIETFREQVQNLE